MKKLCEEIVRITGREARDTNTCRRVRELKQFDATLNARRIAPCVARHQVACQNIADGGLCRMASNAFLCERAQSENCFAAVVGTSTPPVINEV